jgi:uncharacterized protein with PIN domain
MSRRQCPECGGELVLARRSENQHGEFEARPSNYWRCLLALQYLWRGIYGRTGPREKAR